MELETTCDNCGNHALCEEFNEGDIVICYVCGAEFEIVDDKLIYIKNTGDRE